MDDLSWKILLQMDDLGIPPFEDPPGIIPSYEMVEQTQKALKQEKPTSSFLGAKLDHCPDSSCCPDMSRLGEAWDLSLKYPLLPSRFCVYWKIPKKINHAQLLEHCRSGRTETCQPIQDCTVGACTR